MSQYPERTASTALPDTSIEVALRDAVDELPDAYRAPIVLCYFMGETHAAAAQTLGVPAGSISTKLRVGQEKLRNKLKRMGFVVPIVAITWLLTQMRAEAMVPEQLISSTLAKASTSVTNGGKLATNNSQLIRRLSAQQTFSQYGLIVLGLIAMVAIAEAFYSWPNTVAPPAQPSEVDHPVPVNSAFKLQCCEETL